MRSCSEHTKVTGKWRPKSTQGNAHPMRHSPERKNSPEQPSRRRSSTLLQKHLPAQFENAVAPASANQGHAEGRVHRSAGSVKVTIAAGEISGLEPEIVGNAGDVSGVGMHRRFRDKVAAETAVGGLEC
ncbi:hypothetical protein V8G54_031444 [Vigna mungo]|uniref:Uncharacterized protein n=1 Tax=Vigna mungo TaxID=3915 RepID=A0AAQ3MJI2_VIGMU